eukprot:scaffold11700_cov124-Isochrysis_galbana.AAC.2
MSWIEAGRKSPAAMASAADCWRSGAGAGASTSGVMPSLPASARRSARARFQMASRATMSLMVASAAQRAAASAGNVSWMAASEAP